jgi:hypothetical protein
MENEASPVGAAQGFNSRSALLRASLRRKESFFCPLYPALAPSARKRASGRAWANFATRLTALNVDSCWIHNCPECPEHIEVIELRRVVRGM